MKHKVKAFMDALIHDEGSIVSAVIDQIPYKYQDDTYEFTIEVTQIKKIETTEDFRSIEINEIQ